MNQLELFAYMDARLLEDVHPSTYFENLYTNRQMQIKPFNMLYDLKHIPQNMQHHPEGNVWNHTMLVIDEASKVKENSTDKRVFMWAAVLHDIGKIRTTKNIKGKITSYDHDKIGAEMVYDFFSYLDEEEEFINKVSYLVRWHMQILFVVKDLPFAEIEKMKKQVNIKDVALLGLCDRIGRSNADIRKEKNNIEIFLKKCRLK